MGNGWGGDTRCIHISEYTEQFDCQCPRYVPEGTSNENRYRR